VPVVFIITALVFAVTMLLPGDPALAILGVQQAKDEQAVQALREELGLNQPVPVQYVKWLGRVASGDFGRSILNKQPVLQALVERLPITLELGLLSMALSVVIALPLGIYAALRHDTVADLLMSVGSLVGIAMPSFWLGILMIELFAVNLRLLPASGYVPFSQSPSANLQLLLMPVIVLGLESAAGLMRQVRSAMLEVLGQDYVRTAYAKGVTTRGVLWRHALRNAMIPVVTIIGLRVARLIGGATVVESVFAIPGVGRLAIESIFNRDFPVLQAIVLMVALAVLLCNLLTDLIYGFLDPRIRYT
jgi:peptide/nickel transport system permease protein